ncbi:hypothetical protein NDU88_002359 [Pleurodeles waltl]|uniref:Uncharacterized protein n=1 Tax=Pleurodeles waltl TaxID=8319 RepID=A0AAV7Q6V1_PLEWA|nr:hypothetical protein NDU88_002359 [Pleurodeles waltl]
MGEGRCSLLWFGVAPVAVSGTLVRRRPCRIRGHVATASALILGHAASSSRSQLLPRTRETDRPGKSEVDLLFYWDVRGGPCWNGVHRLAQVFPDRELQHSTNLHISGCPREWFFLGGPPLFGMPIFGRWNDCPSTEVRFSAAVLNNRIWGEAWLVGKPSRPVAEEESCLATKKLVDNSGIKNMCRRIWYGIGLFKHLAQSGAEVLRSLLEGWGCPLPQLSIASWGTPSHGPGDTGDGGLVSGPRYGPSWTKPHLPMGARGNPCIG